MIFQFLPIVFFSTIFFLVYYIKSRRRKLISFFDKFKEEKSISVEKHKYYIDLYQSIFGYINIVNLPSANELFPEGEEDRDYMQFVRKSNSRGKLYILFVIISVISLFTMAILDYP